MHCGRSGLARTLYLMLCCSGSFVVGLSLASQAGAAADHHGCLGRRATIVGTQGPDRIIGTPRRDVVVALHGIDSVLGEGGDDIICLGPGGSPSNEETSNAGGGDDILMGGPGTDWLHGGDSGADILRGESGPDQLFGYFGHDTLKGGPGRDYLDGRYGRDVLKGGEQSDRLIGGLASDLIIGGSEGRGVDTVEFPWAEKRLLVNLTRGRAKSHRAIDKLFGVEGAVTGYGNDKLVGNSKQNLLRSGFGNDVLVGRRGRDCLTPGPGDNRVLGGNGYDYYSANPFSPYAPCKRNPNAGSFIHISFEEATVDLAAGTAESDDETSTLNSIQGVFGSYYGDTLRGDSGRNFIFGGPSGDLIEGREGNDDLDGAGNYDTLNGGPDFDSCINGEVVANCES
jgi:Ca2+-binding RTX toxin-like protein